MTEPEKVIPASNRAVTLSDNALASISQILGEQYLDMQKRVAGMVVRLRNATTVCNDDATSGVLSDLYKDADKLAKEVEATRVNEKAPFLEAERRVDSFFNPLKGAIAERQTVVGQTVTAYLLRKKAEEERRAQEAARKAREEEARLRQQAAEAAAKAEEAKRKATAERQRDAAAEATVLADHHAQVAEHHEEKVLASGADKARTRGGASLATLQEPILFEVTSWDTVDLEALRPYLERPAIEKAIKGKQRTLKEAALDNGGTTAIRGVRFYKGVKGRIT